MAFSPLWYDFDDAGKTFNYAIREKQGEEQGVSYDDRSLGVVVNVVARDSESKGVAIQGIVEKYSLKLFKS